MDKRLLRYAGGGGAISLLACGLLCMALGALAGGDVAGLVAANPHRARTLFAEVFQDNPGSARVLTNCGFAYLGDAESWSVARNSRVPTWTYLRRMAE